MAEVSDSKRKSARRRLSRRNLKRIPAAFSTPVVEGKGQISKLSRRGLFFSTEKPPSPGEAVCVVFRDGAGNKIDIEGTVRLNTAQMRPNASGFGMSIERASDEYLEFYEQMLTR